VTRAVRLLAASLIVVAACSSEGPSADERRIVLQVSGEQEEIAVYQGLVSAFEDRNPSIDVTLVPVADKDDHLTRLASSFAVGDPPDVFLVNFREYSQFVVRGAIEPFSEHLEEAGISIDDYYPQPIEAFTLDGELQCMPQNISSLVVYYNRDLWQRASLKHPRNWSWERFRDAAIALTNGDVRGLGIEPTLIRLAPFAWSNGGDIVDDLGSPTRLTLDDPATREALEFIVSLVRDDRVVPTEEEVASEDLETRFAAGRLGMLLESRKVTPVFREVSGLNWDVAPLAVAEEPAGILHSDAYCIAASSDDIDAAVAFVSFALNERGQAITAFGGRTVPSLISVSRSQAFLDPLQPPAHPRVFLDNIPQIRRTPVIPTWPEIEDLAEEILTRAFYEDGYSIDDAIHDLENATAPLFEEARQ
jgi:multiple sugar transport system substrate-binding protein